METIITSHSVSSLNLKSPSLKSKFNQSLFHHGPNFNSFQPSVRLQYSVNDHLRLISHNGFRVSIKASMAGQNSASVDEYNWLLEPVGQLFCFVSCFLFNSSHVHVLINNICLLVLFNWVVYRFHICAYARIIERWLCGYMYIRELNNRYVCLLWV